MKLFRLNETSGRRQRLFRPVRRENGRLVLVRGSAPRGQVPTQKPVGQTNVPKPLDRNRCPRCQDLEQQTTRAQLRHRTCVRTCTTVSVILFVIVFPFFVFAIVAIAAFCYREDLSSSEKWEYLTG